MEKNIEAHNKDVKTMGHYVYTDPNLLSARLSTTTIQDHMEELIRKHLKPDISILDVGCGDGTFTIDLFKRLKKASITAIEPAEEAVRLAISNYQMLQSAGGRARGAPSSAQLSSRALDGAVRGQNLRPNSIAFTVGNAYTIKYKPNQFDLLLIRSVLHHLYDPQKALSNLVPFAKYCLIVEPNGYSPLLKIIEKISPYHRHHEERSFFPHTVHAWLRQNNFSLIESRFINLVPTFAPDWLAKTAKALEPAVETIPILKHLALAQNITLWIKNNR